MEGGGDLGVGIIISGIPCEDWLDLVQGRITWLHMLRNFNPNLFICFLNRSPSEKDDANLTIIKQLCKITSHPLPPLKISKK